MRLSGWIPALILVIFSISTSFATAADRCENLFYPSSRADGFWDSDRPVVLGHVDGRPLELTYSFDSEVELGRLWSVCLSAVKDEDKAALKEVFDELLPNPLDWRQINAALGEVYKSEKQVLAFVLRRGIDPAQKEFRLTDVKPAYMQQVFESGYYGRHIKGQTALGRLISETGMPIVSKLLRKPINAHRDGWHVEFTHSSSEAIPKSFTEFIFDFHELFPEAQTHFHVGLPSAIVTESDALAIGRALETKIILGYLANPRRHTSGLRFANSVFGPIHDGMRGVIKLEYNQFKLPVAAHDLEVRQWDNVDDGLNSVEAISNLALNPAIVRDIDIPERQISYDDNRYGHTFAALRFAGEVLRRFPKTRNLGEQLVELSDTVMSDYVVKVNGLQSMSPEALKYVERFLIKNNVLQIYQSLLMTPRPPQ